MRRSSLWILSPLVLAAVWLAGCGKSGDPDRITIGLAVPSLSHPLFIYLRDHVMDEAGALGVKVIAADAQDSAAHQMSVVENFIVRDVDGVLMSPIGADALVPAVEALNKAAIPVATVDRKVNGGRVLVHVGADNIEGGRGGVIGTFVGALLIGTINNGMNLLGVSPYWQLVAKGAIIVAAALLDRLREH